MDVDENGGLFEGYQLKLNSYDLGVDIELADAVQRLRFEQPGVKVVVLRSGKSRVFCAGANIRMLAGFDPRSQGQLLQVHQRDPQRTGGFQREFRPAFYHRRQRHRGRRRLRTGAGHRPHYSWPTTAAAAVSLPEVPLLAVLPGTGGLTRVVDKRKVRRDHADYFCTIEEGIKGKRAVSMAAGR